MPSDDNPATDTTANVQAANLPEADTTASVRAATLPVSEADVLQSHGTAAPSDPVLAQLNEHGNRLTQLEAVIGTIDPLVLDALPSLAALVPAAGPVLQLLPSVIGTVNAIIAALAAQGPGRVAAALPDPIAAPAKP